jgi:hypothetical protein
MEQMRNLRVEPTKITPLIQFSLSGELKIEGRSIPEDPEKFYNQVFEWIENYFNQPAKQTKLDIQLEYINSGSSKFILAFLKLFKENYRNGIDCEINWIYEEDDENLHELGVHYKTLLNMPFNLVEIY